MLSLLLVNIFSLLAFDELEDPKFEKRVNDIYKAHYSSVVTDQEWSGFISKIEDNEYGVRAGDTLWDLSKVFFADGLYWSKLWSVNEKITNPHLIYVGAKIRFFSGSTTSPPGIQVSEDAKINEGIALKAEPEDIDAPPPPPGMKPVNISKEERMKPPRGLYPGAPAIPPPKEIIKPVPSGLPSSFVQAKPDKNRYDKQGISFDVRPPLRIAPRFVPHSFLFPGVFSNYPRTGRITEVEDGEEIAGVNKYIYLDASRNYSVGDLFTIMGSDFSFNYGLTFGEVIQYKGVARVVDVIGGSRYRAQIVQAINPVTVGSWASDESIPHLSDDNVGRPKDVRAKVIGGAVEASRQIFATGDIVFLDSGSSSGLNNGDILGIYKNRDDRYDNNSESESPRPIAHLKIFRSDTSVASAFIFQASESVIVGDRTGTAILISNQSSESEQLDLDSIEGNLEFDDGTETSDGSDETLEDELNSETL